MSSLGHDFVGQVFQTINITEIIEWNFIFASQMRNGMFGKP